MGDQVQRCHHADQGEEPSTQNGHQHGVAILPDLGQFGIQGRLREMFESAHVLPDLQHQRPAFALFDIFPRLIGVLRLHGIDQQFLLIDELLDQLLHGGNEGPLIILLRYLSFQCAADVQDVVLRGAIGKQVMFLARQHKTPEPCFQVNHESQVF